MDPLQVNKKILDTLVEKGFEIIREMPVQKCDFVVRHPKFQLVGFFKIFNTGDDLLQHWLENQEETRENLEIHANIANRFNTYLVFALHVDEIPSNKEIQTIFRDEHVCRKLIIPIEGEDIQKSLARLPFYPFEIAGLLKERIPNTVTESLSSAEFPCELIADIAKRVSIKTILKKIKEKKYNHKQDVSKKYLQSVTKEDYRNRKVKIKKISIDGFRGIGNRIELDTEADIVVIYGANGTGKTSIVDAIEWAITGEVERLEGENQDKPININESLVNLFSRRQIGEVQLEFSADNGINILENRAINLTKSKKTLVKLDNNKSSDESMIRKLVGIRMPKIDIRRLRKAFSRTHFLKQSTILEFLAQNPTERYNAFSRMVGTQDYILFIDKIEFILKLLNKEQETHSLTEKNLNFEEKQISEKIETKKVNLKTLQKDIKTELSIRKIADKARSLFKDVKLETADFLFGRKKDSPNIEEIKKMIDIIEGNRSLSTGRINALNELLTEANAEKNRNQEQVTLRSSLNQMVLQVASFKATKRKAQETLEIIDKELKKYSAEKDNYQKKILAIEWQIVTFPKYKRSQEELNVLRKTIAELTEEKEKLQNKIKSAKENQLTYNNNIQKLLKDEDVIKKNRYNLLQLKNHLPQFEANVKKATQLQQVIQDIKNEIAACNKDKSKLEKELNDVTNEIKVLEVKLGTEREKQNRKQQLIVKLKEYLDSSICPVCGYDWKKKENLYKQTEKMTSFLDSIIKSLNQDYCSKADELKSSIQDLLFFASEHEKKLIKKNNINNRLEVIFKDIQSKNAKIDGLIKEEYQLAGAINNSKTIISDLKNSYPEFKNQKIEIRSHLLPLVEKYDTDIYANKTKQKDLEKDILALSSELNQLEQMERNIERQIKSNQEKENKCEKTIHDIRKDTSQKGITGLTEQTINELKKISEDLLAKLEKVKTEIDQKQPEYEKNNMQLSDISNLLEKVDNEQNMQKEKLSRLEAESNNFKDDLQKEGIAIDKSDLVIKNIEIRKKEELEKFRKYENIKILLQMLKSAVTISDLRSELDKIVEEKEEKEKELNDIIAISKELSRWANKLTKLKKLVEQKRKEQENSHLEMCGPAANLVYSRLNAHPLFNNIQLETLKNELKILAVLTKSESISRKNCDEVSPKQFFSEAQLNIVAISIFLASSLQQNWSDFSTTIFDDPVQNMDDFNVYAFLDLIRGLIMNGHQFILTTCNRDLYKLILLKFRDLNNNKKHRFNAYRLKGIYAEGPELIRDI